MNARSLGMKLVLVLVATTLMSGIAAADVDCTGEVTNLSLQLDDAGTVTLSLAGGPTNVYLCNVDGIRNGVSPTVCRAMYSTLTTAKVTGRKMKIRFYSHSDCSTIPSWQNAGTLGWTQLLLD